MRRTPSCSALLCLLLATGACRHAPPSDDAAHLRALDAAWSRALEAKDLDAVMGVYADDAVLLAPNQPLVEGKERIRAWFARVMAQPGYSARFAPTRIVVSRSRELAYELGTFRASALSAAGEPITRVGKHLVTWERRDGRWVVVAESINHDAPPPIAR